MFMCRKGQHGAWLHVRQSTLEYLTGSAPTQQAAATGIGIVAGSGGNMYSLTAYYNNMQNVNGYVYKPNTTSKGEMLSNHVFGHYLL